MIIHWLSTEIYEFLYFKNMFFVNWQPTSNENLNLSSASNDEVREAMSKSRASLRTEYKARLAETKLAMEDRRSKSPAVSIPSLHSLDEDQLIEDDVDLDALMPDNRKGNLMLCMHLCGSNL